MPQSQVEKLMAMSASARAKVFRALSDEERAALLTQIEFVKQNPWLRYEGNPQGFVENGLGERLWSKQREILQSIIENQRTVVPACHAPGKTHLAARVVAYWVACHPIGTAKVLTTASFRRQVERLLWPHIRRLQSLHLPDLGYTNTMNWMIGDPPEAVAEGFKPPDDDEAAIQGDHKANMLIVVDEGGGIKKNFGDNLESLMTGGNTRMLVTGNPPTDEEGTWFERICSSPRFNTVRISAFDTPNFTKEDTGPCRSCPRGMAPHPISLHLVDKAWVEGIRESFGEESAYWIARVLADFPHDHTAKAIPLGYLEASSQNVWEPDGIANRVSLGADIASDGGDEFAVAMLDGWHAKVVHSSRGKENEDPMKVAGIILQYIREAERKHEVRGVREVPRVKIDTIGVGWGVAGILQSWKKERRFKAEIVPVNVAEKARDEQKFVNKRAELWWNLRTMIQPAENREPATPLWLDLTSIELAQLNGPGYSNDSHGRIQIESKKAMKNRGVHSPDRAESILLAIYEPKETKISSRIVGVGQANPWAALG